MADIGFGKTRSALLAAALGVATVLTATAKDVSNALGAPSGVVVGIAIVTGLIAVALAVLTYIRTERESARLAERQVVNELLAFLEDKRLLTDDTGYQSHFPDHLRESAEDIRRRTNEALQKIDRASELIPILKKIQEAARNFQEAMEGSMDGSRGERGLAPILSTGLDRYLRSLHEYREVIGTGMSEAAELYGLELDQQFRANFEEGQRELESLARSVRGDPSPP